MVKPIEDLDSDEDIVQDKPHPSTILITKKISNKQAHHKKISVLNTNLKARPTDVDLAIRGCAQQAAITKRKIIQAKIKCITEDLTKIKHLQARRQRHLAEVIPYIKKHLFDIYRLDNEPLTYNQLKNEYLKDLFPDDLSALSFKKKYLQH